MPIPLPVLAVRECSSLDNACRVRRRQWTTDWPTLKWHLHFHILLLQGMYFWVICHGLKR